MPSVIDFPQRNGLTPAECNDITAKCYKHGVEFDLTESGAMVATIGDRWSVFRERGEVVLMGDLCNVLMVSRSLPVVLDSIRV
jgi:hypothetical protein